MKILSIGNSFSQDAQRYLHQISEADGMDIESVNLYIGGCPLSIHHSNMLSNAMDYDLEINGSCTGIKISLKEALLKCNWDVITLQQASYKSPYYETYQPYLNELVAYIRSLVPNAKIVIHQTWAYEQGCPRLLEELNYKHYKDMLSDIKKAYKQAASDINADGIIPSGEVFDALLDNGIESVHSDTFHASFGLGRYALGLTWYKFLTSNDIENNTFNDFDEPIPANQIEIVKKCVSLIFNSYNA